MEAAIATTAPVAPDAIRPEVEQLARSLKHTSLPNALRRLAVELAHPISDLVVASLTVAANGAVRDLAELLGMLADSARDEAAMQMRAWRRRGPGCELQSGDLWCHGRDSAGPGGAEQVLCAGLRNGHRQVVLVAIAAAWGTALWWLASMSRFRQPERFLIAAAEGTIR